MKKYFIIFIMLFLFIFSSYGSNNSFWKIKHFVDEFDMPTNRSYIVNEKYEKGKFSNSATTDSKLDVVVFFQDFADTKEEFISFGLIEYGWNEVKNSFSENEYYDIRMMDNAGQKYTLTGYMPAKGSKVRIVNNDCEIVVNALKQGGTVRFVFVEKENGLNKYSFTIDANGFNEAYSEWKAKK